MNIVLVGFMGTGKSSTGRLLAKRLGWSFVDTDEWIEKQVGSSIAEIIRSEGEGAFRDVERKAIQVVSLMDRAVISTGGGVPLSADNMQDLSRSGTVVWLKASPAVIVRRIKNPSSRPLVDPADALGSVERRLKGRIPFYEKARFSIDTDGLSKEQVVERIESLVTPLIS